MGGLLPVTSYQDAHASSYIEGRNPMYAVDESTQTWWQPATDDTERFARSMQRQYASAYSARLKALNRALLI